MGFPNIDVQSETQNIPENQEKNLENQKSLEIQKKKYLKVRKSGIKKFRIFLFLENNLKYDLLPK